MWSPQHFKYIYFLNKNIGEQSLLPTPKLELEKGAFLLPYPNLPLSVLWTFLFAEGLSLGTAQGS